MDIPNVLALPLEEAEKRLQSSGYTCEIQSLLPPREHAEDYQDPCMRKYVVRQQVLSDDKIVLTIVYR